MNFTRFSLKLEPLWILILSLAPLFQVTAQSGTVVRRTGMELLKEIIKWQEPE